MEPKVYFYPHAYLRDRHLDTIRRWPADRVLNPEIVALRQGAQVSREKALSAQPSTNWIQRVPLLNVKRRPKNVPDGIPVYVWGGLPLTGPFIVDVDNPYAFTGYNLRAMPIYRPVIRRILESGRCREIRCMSEACRLGLRQLFGEKVYRKAVVHYPYMPSREVCLPPVNTNPVRFVYISTQFEIKGGVALLRAVREAYAQEQNFHLDLITHLPPEHEELAQSPAITVHPAAFSREQIAERFFQTADVLIHPTYVESFGMVVLEALSYGLAMIATDVYAIDEMVETGVNGALLPAPISVWNGILPSRHFYEYEHFKQHIRETDTAGFEALLTASILEVVRDRRRLTEYRNNSLDRFQQRFAPPTDNG